MLQCVRAAAAALHSSESLLHAPRLITLVVQTPTVCEPSSGLHFRDQSSLQRFDTSKISEEFMPTSATRPCMQWFSTMWFMSP
jgi:hypothetical protein